MRSKEIKELKNRPAAELHKMLSDNREKLRELKFNLEMGKVKNINEVRKVKKLIARISTFIHEK